MIQDECGWCASESTLPLWLPPSCPLSSFCCSIQEEFDVAGEISKGNFGVVYKIVRKGALLLWIQATLRSAAYKTHLRNALQLMAACSR